MSRLATEFSRLYLPPGSPAPPGGPQDYADGEGRVRALVLGVHAPAEWEPLAAVWTGVQRDLGLPAPAIAVSGDDALQLWFSLAEPVTPHLGRAWLDALCRHYLPDWPARRLQCLCGDRYGPLPWPMAPALRQSDAEGERWSAWIAPDLAPLFADTPWLDLAPGDEAQAQRLAGLQPIPAALFEATRRRLAGEDTAPPAGDSPSPWAVAVVAPAATALQPPPTAVPDGDGADDRDAARRFLRGVMDDPQAPLALRLEAARVLLHGG